MSEHTPGPWRVEAGTTLVWGACTLQDDGTPDRLGVPVADAQLARPWADGEPSHETAAANARLIAAAPDLYDALLAAKHGAEYPDELGDIIDAAISKVSPPRTSPAESSEAK